MEQTSKSTSPWKPIGIGLGILAVLFGLYFGLAWILRKTNSALTAGPSPSLVPLVTQSADNNQSSAQALIGTWTTDCLVPDQDSPWSEKHQFIFQANGTAVHTRWSNDTMAHDCSPSGTPGILVDNYQYTVVGSGKINFKDTSTGAAIYDIYQVSNNTLEFGHGFCNCTKGGPYGGSEAERFTTLNTFLVYKKIQ